MAIMRILEHHKLLLNSLSQYRTKAGGHNSNSSLSYFSRVARSSCEVKVHIQQWAPVMVTDDSDIPSLVYGSTKTGVWCLLTANAFLVLLRVMQAKHCNCSLIASLAKVFS